VTLLAGFQTKNKLTASTRATTAVRHLHVRHARCTFGLVTT